MEFPNASLGGPNYGPNENAFQLHLGQTTNCYDNNSPRASPDIINRWHTSKTYYYYPFNTTEMQKWNIRSNHISRTNYEYESFLRHIYKGNQWVFVVAVSMNTGTTFFFLEGNHSLFLSKELIPKGSRIMLAYLHT